MRPAPMMKVEIAGDVVRRAGVLEVLRRDSEGNPTVSHMRPELRAGEVLIERLGKIPKIVRSAP